MPQKTDAKRIEAIERQRQALELRKAGVSFDVIAQRLGYAQKSGAYKAVKSALERTIQEPADELRRLEVERLDAMQRALWQDVLRGGSKAIAGVLAIMDRRAKLLGLDAPTKQEMTGKDGAAIVFEIARRAEQDAD